MLVVVLGVAVGLLVAAGLVGAGTMAYRSLVRPWHRRWGATVDEVAVVLPGDELVADAHGTTRAIDIDATPESVWPWLVQIGWGRAGWYSYDRIDNDGEPSADTVEEAWQGLTEGDRILMTPDQGFVVRRLAPPHTLVALSDDGSTSWSLDLRPTGDGSRLVSRFRTRRGRGPASWLWALVVDPGAFVMERRMLRGIAARAGHDLVGSAPR